MAVQRLADHSVGFRFVWDKMEMVDVMDRRTSCVPTAAGPPTHKQNEGLAT